MNTQTPIEYRPSLFAHLRGSDTVRTYLACAVAAAVVGATIFVLAGLIDNWPDIRAGIARLLEAGGGYQFALGASLGLWAMTAASWLCTYRHIDELRWMVVSTLVTSAYVLMLAGVAALAAGETVELTTYQRLLTYFLYASGAASIIVCLFAWFCIGLEYYEDLDF